MSHTALPINDEAMLEEISSARMIPVRITDSNYHHMPATGQYVCRVD